MNPLAEKRLARNPELLLKKLVEDIDTALEHGHIQQNAINPHTISMAHKYLEVMGMKPGAVPAASELYLGVAAGFVQVPLKLTPEMKAAGGHANSEWLNDSAPIGEARYAVPMESVWAAILAAAPGGTE